MCKNCKGRALTPARQAILNAQRAMQEEARNLRLGSLPGYHRVISVSEHGITGNGIMRLNAMPGVRITKRREDDGFVYTISLDNTDKYDTVKVIIEEERPPKARAEAARVNGMRPTHVVKMLENRARAQVLKARVNR